MKSSTLLIVDDHPSILTSLELLFENHCKKVISLSDPNQIPTTLEQNKVDVVLLDMNFKMGRNTGNEGIYWLGRILETNPGLPVIMITAYGDMELAVKAIKNGASEFIVKPWDNQKAVACVRDAIQIHRKKKIENRKKGSGSQVTDHGSREREFVTGPSREMKVVMELIEQVAPTEANILITGENGTGKEMLAREIHRRSKRSKETMIGVDIGSIPEGLFESELFGHTKGAFTDAKNDRMGKILMASGSSLFIDEIGNLPPVFQQKLLRVLQNREVTPVGSNQVIPVDLRLISATNKNLGAAILKDDFREDLFFRINTITIEIPPLRNRPEDIPSLAYNFLNHYAGKYNKARLGFSQKALDNLTAYQWPGNIRELQHAVEKAVILSQSDQIQATDFNLVEYTGQVDFHPKMTLADMEKKMIMEALKIHQGNLSAVAGQLGITRQTLYRKIDRYGL